MHHNHFDDKRTQWEYDLYESGLFLAITYNMKKTYVWLGILAVLIIGGIFLLNNTNEYVVVVDREITELEIELSDIEAAITEGTLTPEAAAEAEAMIVSRLESINASVEKGQRVKLTPAQKTQLNEALGRLKQILLDYQATLLVVQAQVEELPEVEKRRLKGSGNVKKVTEVVMETVTGMEEVMKEIVDDYTETSIEELFEENASSSEEQSEEWLDNQSTTTEDAEGVITDDEEENVAANEGTTIGEYEDEEEMGQGESTTDETTDDRTGTTENEESNFGFVGQEEESVGDTETATSS